MARKNYDTWVPITYSPDVVQQVMEMSALEWCAGNGGRTERMTSETKKVPRSATVTIELGGRGVSYGEDAGTIGDITLTTGKFQKGFRIAEEDLDWSYVGVLEDNVYQWNRAYGMQLDIAAFGVMAARSTTASDGRPFNSVYYTLKAAGPVDAYDGYTAGLHLVTASAVSHGDLSQILGLVEKGPYFEQEKLVWIMDPVLRQGLRDLVDDQNRPIFADNLAARQPDTLFGIPIRWSFGARLNADMESIPAAGAGVSGTAGNSLAIIANRRHLVMGRWKGPESQLVPASISQTDEALLKVRSYRAFYLSAPKAAAVLEITS